MSRPLKFRVFDKATKRMSDPFHLFGETTCFNLIEQWLMEYPEGKRTLERMRDIEEMQWTGLKDKNGVEIYEGDIVATIKHTAMVIFEGSGWKLKHINSDKRNRCLPKNGSGIEVIGNKFSNPELTP